MGPLWHALSPWGDSPQWPHPPPPQKHAGPGQGAGAAQRQGRGQGWGREIGRAAQKWGLLLFQQSYFKQHRAVGAGSGGWGSVWSRDPSSHPGTHP